LYAADIYITFSQKYSIHGNIQYNKLKDHDTVNEIISKVTLGLPQIELLVAVFGKWKNLGMKRIYSYTSHSQ